MNWIRRFISTLYESGEQYSSDGATGVPAIDATLVSDYLQLPWNLKLLYGLWAAVAIALPAIGVYAILMRSASTWGAWGALSPLGALGAPPVSVTTILLLGGIGLLYECVLGIKLDATGEGYASRSRRVR